MGTGGATGRVSVAIRGERGSYNQRGAGAQGAGECSYPG